MGDTRTEAAGSPQIPVSPYLQWQQHVPAADFYSAAELPVPRSLGGQCTEESIKDFNQWWRRRKKDLVLVEGVDFCWLKFEPAKNGQNVQGTSGEDAGIDCFKFDAIKKGRARQSFSRHRDNLAEGKNYLKSPYIEWSQWFCDPSLFEGSGFSGTTARSMA